MTDVRASEPLQPALLDRLLDDTRTVTRFEVTTSAETLRAAGVDLVSLTLALASAGLKRVESAGAAGGIALAYVAPGRTVGLGDVKALKVRASGNVAPVALPAICDVQARIVANTESDTIERRSMSARRLRECVLRDLAWLFNAINLDAVDDLEPFPRVANSVINYGMPSLAGRIRSSIAPQQLAERIRTCIETFEPRLSKLSVTPATGADGFSLDFRIEAELWGQPLPQQVLFQTHIDLTSGDVSLQDGGDG